MNIKMECYIRQLTYYNDKLVMSNQEFSAPTIKGLKLNILNIFTALLNSINTSNFYSLSYEKTCVQKLSCSSLTYIINIIR